MSTISIQQLREKYKKIIQSEDSEEQTVNKTRKSISFKKATTQMRFLTEHCQNIPIHKAKDASSNSVIVALKERIAQGLKNLSEKDRQIEEFKQAMATQKLEISKLESQIAEYRKNIEENNAKFIEEKVNSTNLQKQIQKLKNVIKDQHIDKELVFKQIEFYKKQIKDLRHEKNEVIHQLHQSKKSVEMSQRLKSDNNRLKENIKRMQTIINQCCRQSVKTDLTDKYYLGKPLKQSSFWYSRNLVGEIQTFLKKWQIGFHNKDFIDALVKFVDQYHKSSMKTMSASKIKTTKSLQKDGQSKRYSTSVQFHHDISVSHKEKNQNSLKKSILLNKIKKKNNIKYAQSLFEEEKEVTSSSKICEEMLDQYEKALKLALEQNEIKPKKIMMLSKELKESFTNFMDETKSKS